jgi:crotonobetainyl-CoA:carnitine CoA-transferase CaiB-like acyl-CoA transferase
MTPPPCSQTPSILAKSCSSVAPGDLATVDARRHRRDEVRALLTGWMSSHAADDAVEALQAAGVSTHAVQDAEDLATRDPRLRHRDALIALDSPVFGQQHTDRFPGRLFDGNGAELHLQYRASLYLGEHNFDVYGDLLHMDAAEVAERMGDGLFS